MKLLEFEAKALLGDHGIPFPQGGVAVSADDAESIARSLGRPVVLKAQIPVAGRGKAGGILRAADASEARAVADSLLGAVIKNCLVESILVEEALDIATEYYLSVAIDRAERRYVILASAHGGVDVEQAAQTSPEGVARSWADPVSGFDRPAAHELVRRAGITSAEAGELAGLLVHLFAATLERDAELTELNPLVATSAGALVAVDARMIVDENALFRHPDIQEEALNRERTPREIEARERGLAYVDLAGTIGVVGNGAGLVMATIDLVSYFGGSPANFLDIGGGGEVDITRDGLLLVLEKPEVEAVVVNVFGGITRCDIVARAVIEAANRASVKKPVAVSIMGTNHEEGQRLLDEAGISSYADIEESVAGIMKTLGKNEHSR